MKLPIEKDLLLFLLGLTLILLLFYFPWLSNSSSYFFRDLTHYIEPFARFTGESMRQLCFPLWNPWCYCGMPQMSISVQGICYPPTWLFAILPFSSALAANMLLHQLLCGLGGFLLVRSLAWGTLPATICGVTLALSGYEFCFTSIFSLVQSSAWCPITVWAFYELGKCMPPPVQPAPQQETEEPAQPAPQQGTGEPARPALQQEDEAAARPAQQSPAAWIALAAVLLGLHVMAGHPELSSIQMMLVFGFVALSFLFSRKKSQSAKEILFWRLKALFLGLLFAMPTILPALEWLTLSRRSTGLETSESLILSANWYDLLCLVLAQPLGDLQLRFSEFRPLVMKGQLLPYMATAFVGPVVTTLAIWSLADSKWKARWIFLGLLVLALLLALGENSPFLPAIIKVVRLPIRFPVKLMFFAVWVLAVMAARGIYCCCNRGTAGSNGKGLAASALFWLLIASLGTLLLNGINPFAALMYVQSKELLSQAQSMLGWSCLSSSAVGLILSLVIWICQKRQYLPRLLPQLITGAAALTLLLNAYWFCRCPGPADFFEEPSLVAEQLKSLRQKAKIGDGRVLDLFFEHFTVPPKYLQSKSSLDATISTYQYSRQLMRSNTNIDFHEASSFGFEGSCTGEYFFFLTNCYGKSTQAKRNGSENAIPGDSALARVCQASGTKYVISQVYRYTDRPDKFEPIPALESRYFLPVYENADMNLRIYELQKTLPRAYFADCWQWIDSHDEALSQAFDPDRSGYDPSQKILLESSSNQFSLNKPDPELKSCSSENQVKISSDRVNELSLEVEAKRSGYLVLSDQYYPGWEAELDGERREILRANCFFRAVYVPEGKHQIRFIYQPASFYAGLLIFVLSILLMLIGLRRSKAT